MDSSTLAPGRQLRDVSSTTVDMRGDIAPVLHLAVETRPAAGAEGGSFRTAAFAMAAAAITMTAAFLHLLLYVLTSQDAATDGEQPPQPVPTARVPYLPTAPDVPKLPGGNLPSVVPV